MQPQAPPIVQMRQMTQVQTQMPNQGQGQMQGMMPGYGNYGQR
jgi:hypothetical protein